MSFRNYLHNLLYPKTLMNCHLLVKERMVNIA